MSIPLTTARAGRWWQLCATLALGAAAGAVLPATAAAQQFRGVVRAGSGTAAVDGAAVIAFDESGRERGRTVSDPNGLFVLSVPNAGDYRLSVERIGYAEFTSDIVPVAAGELVRVEIRLSRTAVQLEPLQVVSRRRDPHTLMADYHDRVDFYGRIGAGRFITREQIEARSPSSFEQLLRFGSGLLIDAAVPTIGRGGCTPKFFVDGTRAEWLDLEMLSPSIVEGVEVYRGVAEMPGTFHDETGCGVVLVWTQRGEGISRPLTWRRLAALGGVIALTFVLMSF
jgi:hypothetical protein